MMITNLILRSQSKGAFLLQAERGGLNLFYDDLPNNRDGIINRKNMDVPVDQRDLMMARHSESLNHYIRFLRNAKNRIKSNGEFHDQAVALQRDIAKVNYKVSDEGVITARPTAKPNQRSGQELGIHLASSTVKNLYGLWAWLESSAAPGAYLMIDEPELNLHPDNQRLVARLLARLVNRGIRVVISTHSDYIVREVNNMIMLGSEFPERADMEREFGYDDAGSERLRAEDVVAYHFTDKGVAKCAISPEFGVEVQSMDDAINRLNKSNSAIYYALGEKLHSMVESAEIRTDNGGQVYVFVIEYKNSTKPSKAQHQIECGAAFCEYLFKLLRYCYGINITPRILGVAAYRPAYRPQKGNTSPQIAFSVQGQHGILRADWLIQSPLPLSVLVAAAKKCK